MTPEAERLATTNMRLVYAIAHAHLARLGGDFDELVGDGMIGLCEAAERFRPGQEGLAFGSYAGRRVLGAMIDGHRKRSHFHRRSRTSQRPVNLDHLMDATGWEPADPRHSTEDSVVAQSEHDRIRRRVDALPSSLIDVVDAALEGRGGIHRLAERDGVTDSAISQRRTALRRRLSHVAAA